MKKAFLICPVRNHSPDETASVVGDLEDSGWTVHWPHRDTNQDDDVGLDICNQNRVAIAAADMVFITWDGESTGSLFDLGMAFALGKPLSVISAPVETSHKSFQNMMRAWAARGKWL